MFAVLGNCGGMAALSRWINVFGMFNELLRITLAAALLTAGCDTTEFIDEDTRAISTAVDDVQAAPDPFPLDSVEVIPGDGESSLVTVHAFDAEGASLGTLTLSVGAAGQAVIGSIVFQDGSRLIEVDPASGGVQVYSQGLSEAEFVRRLGMLELAVTNHPQAGGWSCGAWFAGWLVTCSTTIVGCAVAGWPMACECAQWLEKKTGGGKVFEGGVCEDL